LQDTTSEGPRQQVDLPCLFLVALPKAEILGGQLICIDFPILCRCIPASSKTCMFLCFFPDKIFVWGSIIFFDFERFLAFLAFFFLTFWMVFSQSCNMCHTFMWTRFHTALYILNIFEWLLEPNCHQMKAKKVIGSWVKYNMPKKVNRKVISGKLIWHRSSVVASFSSPYPTRSSWGVLSFEQIGVCFAIVERYWSWNSNA
jgi:hypothetical protein